MKTIKFFKSIKSKFKVISMLMIAFAIGFTSCNKDDDDMADQPSNTIADIAVSNPNFSILVDALSKADLVDDVPVETLKNILLYHVVSGKAMSTDLSNGYISTLATSNGNNLSMYVNIDKGVSLNMNAKVTTADIGADNGVIHVVDKVILPPSVVNIAIDNENFSILVSAVVKAGLVDALSAEGPFTIFAPTNAAFEELFSMLGIAGIDDLTAGQLTPILTYHVVSGNVLSSDLKSGNVGTLNSSSSLAVDVSSGVKINESNVVAADIQGSNGVVHVIDKVLIPE